LAPSFRPAVQPPGPLLHPALVLLVAMATDAGCARGPESGAGGDRFTVGSDGPRPLGEPRTAGGLVIAAAGEARDVPAAGDTVAVAGAGAVVGHAVDGRRRIIGWGDGLGTTLPTAIAAAGEATIVGGAEGTLTILDGATSRTVKLAGGAVTDLWSDGAVI